MPVIERLRQVVFAGGQTIDGGGQLSTGLTVRLNPAYSTPRSGRGNYYGVKQKARLEETVLDWELLQQSQNWACPHVHTCETNASGDLPDHSHGFKWHGHSGGQGIDSSGVGGPGCGSTVTTVLRQGRM